MAPPGPQRIARRQRDGSPYDRSARQQGELLIPSENLQNLQGGGEQSGASRLGIEQVNIEPDAPQNMSESAGRSINQLANIYNTTSSSNSGYNTRTYNNDARHTEIRDSAFRDAVFTYHPLPGPSTAVRTVQAMENLVRTQIGWNILSGQLSVVDQDKFRSRISPLDYNEPLLFWITRNIDFTQWKSADSDTTRALLLSAPHGHWHGMTEVCSDIIGLAKEKASQTKGSVLYFFCSSTTEFGCWTTLTHTLLSQVINCSSAGKANSIAAAFLGTLVDGHFQRSSDFREGDAVDKTVQKILNAPMNELIVALAEAIKEAGMQECSIIVDGLHDSTVCSFFEVIRKACPKLEVLLTSEHPASGPMPHGTTCIEYDKERKECLRFLQHEHTRYDKISNEHHGSLEWLWKHPKYIEWSKSTTSSLIYIEGEPGSGKSTLAKYFEKNLAMREPGARSSVVAHYFYTFRGTKLEPTHLNMLRSLLHSILEQDESAFFHFQQEFRNFRRGNPSHLEWPYESLKTILSSFANHPSTKPLYLILDAMDESEKDDRRDIIELLCKLCSKANICKIKAFVASRPVSELKTIERVYPETLMIRLQDENKNDISRFVDDFLKDLGLTDKALHGATKYIIDNAQGVFVWVELVKRQLLYYAETGCSSSEIVELLESLPRQLETMYERMFNQMENGSPRDIRHGINLFRFALFAFRPLTVEELRHAHAVPDEHNPSNATFQDNMIDKMERRIKHCGGGFFEIKDSTVQLMHQTTRQFLIQTIPKASKLKFGTNEEVANITITTTLIRYLMLYVTAPAMQHTGGFATIESWTPENYRSYAKYLNEWPLMDYALCYIKDHRYRCNQNKRVTELAHALIQQLTNNQASYFLGSLIEFYTEKIGQAIPVDKYQAASQTIKFNTLDAAAELNLNHAWKTLLTSTHNDCQTEQKTPLILSAQKGLSAAARLLIYQNANMDAKDNSGRTALHYAAENGDESIVKLLVEQGADKLIKDDKNMGALELALKKFPYHAEWSGSG